MRVSAAIIASASQDEGLADLAWRAQPPRPGEARARGSLHHKRTRMQSCTGAEHRSANMDPGKICKRSKVVNVKADVRSASLKANDLLKTEVSGGYYGSADQCITRIKAIKQKGFRH